MTYIVSSGALNSTPTYQLPTSVNNVALPAFAAERRAVGRPEAAVVDRYLGGPPGPQQQTRRTLLLRSTDGTDRQTDRRTPYRYIQPSAYYASSVNNPLAWQKVTAAYRRVYDSRHLQVI